MIFLSFHRVDQFERNAEIDGRRISLIPHLMLEKETVVFLAMQIQSSSSLSLSLILHRFLYYRISIPDMFYSSSRGYLRTTEGFSPTYA